MVGACFAGVWELGDRLWGETVEGTAFSETGWEAGGAEAVGLLGCWTVGNTADEDDAAGAGADGFAGPESSSSTPAWSAMAPNKIGISSWKMGNRGDLEMRGMGIMMKTFNSRKDAEEGWERRVVAVVWKEG